MAIVDMQFVVSMLRLHLATRLQYRENFAFSFLGVVIFHVTNLIFINVIFSHFNALGAWSQAEVIFLFGVSTLLQSLADMVFGNLRSVEELHLTGELDLYLSKPANPITLIALREFPETALSNLLVGFAVMLLGSSAGGMTWTFERTGWFVLWSVGAVLVNGGISLILASLAFHFVSAQRWFELKSLLQTEFGRYPLQIFNQSVRVVFTFIVPLAFTSYYPAAGLLGRLDTVPFTATLIYVTPLVGVIIFGFGLLVWHRGLRRYQSTGS